MKAPSGDHTGKAAPTSPDTSIWAVPPLDGTTKRLPSVAPPRLVPLPVTYTIREPSGEKRGWRPSPRDQSHLAPQRGHDIEATAVALGSKHNPGTVRRKRRFVFVSGIGGQTQRRAAVDLLHPQVDVRRCQHDRTCRPTSFPSGDSARIRRQSGVRRQAQDRRAGRCFSRHHAIDPPGERSAGGDEHQSSGKSLANRGCGGVAPAAAPAPAPRPGRSNASSSLEPGIADVAETPGRILLAGSGAGGANAAGD